MEKTALAKHLSPGIELKKFLLYLLQHKLKEAAISNIAFLKEAKVPMLDLYGRMNEEELLAYMTNSLGKFYQQVIDGTAIEAAAAYMQQWKANQLPYIPRNKVEASDIVYVYTARKKVFMQFIAQYTTDTPLALALVQELEELHSQLQLMAITTFAEINREELEQSEKKYRLLAENSSDVITSHNLAAEFLYVSDSIQTLTGYTAQELSMHSPFDLIHPEDLARVQGHHQKLLAEQSEQLFEFRLKVKSGEYRWFESVARIVSGMENEAAQEIQITTRDITARKEIQQVLDEERSYLKAVIENMTEGIAACDKDGRLVFFNNTLQALYGEPDPTMPAHQWAAYFNVFQPDGITLMKEEELPMVRAFKGEKLANVEVVLYSKAGQRKYFCINGQPIVSTDNNQLGAIIIMHDITQTKKAELLLQEQNKQLNQAYQALHAVKQELEQANFTLEKKVEERTLAFDQSNSTLQQREELLRLIIDAAPVLISYIGADFRYKLVSNGYYNWFGVTPEELVGQNVKDFLQGKVPTAELDQYRTLVLNGEKVSYETRFLDKNNKWINATMSYIPHLSEEGKVLGFVVLGIDMTEVIDTRNELADKNKELVSINNDLDNFIYTASHDLKAPILNLEGLFLALNKKMQSHYSYKEQMMVAMVEESIRKFKATIRNLTEIAKVQKDLDNQQEILSFNEVINDVLLDVQFMLTGIPVKLFLDLQISQVQYAPKNLKSILYNLISNSIKYRSPDRELKINIQTFATEGYTILQVRDNGLGIDDKQQARLFTMFKRFHSHVEGTGIGLYIIKKIIENNGGKIEVQSQPGEGTGFKVYLKSM